MITILVDTAEEYDEMMEVAYGHMCRQLAFMGAEDMNRTLALNVIRIIILNVVFVLLKLTTINRIYYNTVGGYPAQCKPRKGGHDSAQSQRILTLLFSGEGG